MARVPPYFLLFFLEKQWFLKFCGSTSVTLKFCGSTKFWYRKLWIHKNWKVELEIFVDPQVGKLKSCGSTSLIFKFCDSASFEIQLSWMIVSFKIAKDWKKNKIHPTMARRRWVFPLANVDGWGWDHGLKCFPGMARASPALWNERVRAVPTPGWLDMMHCFDSILHWFLYRVLVRSVWQVGFSPSFSTEGVLGMEEKGQCMWLHDLGWFLRLETCFDDCFSASLCSQTADGWPLGNFWNICHGFTCTRCTTVHTHTYEQFHSVALRGLTTFIVLVSCCFIRMQNMSVPSCWTQLHASMWMHSNLKHQQWNFNFNHEVTCWWWHSYRHPSHLWSRTNCNWRTLTLHTYFAMSQYHDYTISIIGIYAHCTTLHTVQVQLSMATNWSSQT